MKLAGFDPSFQSWHAKQNPAVKKALADAWASADAVPGHRNEDYARRTAVVALARVTHGFELVPTPGPRLGSRPKTEQ